MQGEILVEITSDVAGYRFPMDSTVSGQVYEKAVTWPPLPRLALVDHYQCIKTAWLQFLYPSVPDYVHLTEICPLKQYHRGINQHWSHTYRQDPIIISSLNKHNGAFTF